MEVLYLLKRTYNAERWITSQRFKCFFPDRPQCLPLITKGIYRFNLAGGTQRAAQLRPKEPACQLSSLTPHGAERRICCLTASHPWEDALQLCPHKTRDPLCWDWCSLPLYAWCLCCPLAPPRHHHKMRLDLTVFQFRRRSETVSGGSRPMGKDT